MGTKDKIEKQILIAMNAIDEIHHLLHLLPEVDDYDGFRGNLGSMKSNLKYYLNRNFDRLARQRSK